MGKGGKRPWHWLVDSFFWLAGCSVTIDVIFMWTLWNWISYSKWGPLRRGHQLRFFPRYPVRMLCSESKKSHANLLHPQFLGVFWVILSANAFLALPIFLGKKPREWDWVLKIAWTKECLSLIEWVKATWLSLVTYV